MNCEKMSKRPNWFPRHLDRFAPMSAHGLRWTRATLKPVRSAGALREPHKGVILQVKGGAPKGVLREGVAPALWADVDGVRAG